MKAIILAAGQGTRLRPHTDTKPKCMVELFGKPLLHHQLTVLRQAGIENIVVVGGYQAGGLKAPGTTLVLNSRYAETNMVSTLFCAESLMQAGEDLLIAYSDIIYEPKVLANLLAIDAPMAVSVDKKWLDLWQCRMEDPLSDAETLTLDEHNNIIELGKKPKSFSEIEGQYIGLIKVRGDFIETVKNFYWNLDRSALYDGECFDNMYMTSFLQQLIDAGYPIKAAFTENGWLEVDTVEDLAIYEKLEVQDTLNSLIKLDCFIL